ncbi:MAG TPA: alpha/beta fold hydrolase, partial [Acidobacteria bacterium]|nr:alpha/beta fold hydrolase [Acidobacteriota bacterium]
FHAAVPQVMQIIPLVAEAVPAPGGTFQGKSIALRQLRLTLAGLVINVLGSDAVPGRLLAVEVPMQKLELIRDGFAVVAREAAAEEGGFRESEVTIDSGGITLGGTLTLPDPRPAGAHLLPGVVLVHGSGPNDRDETIGPNKPFRDLAHDLARRGIAVLRYDKRTFAAKDTLDPATLTVEEETIADAAAAASLLIGHEAIDPRRVYLAGHSLGGMLAPWIARREPRLAGLILLAGSNLPLDEMIVEQSEYLARRQGVSEQAEERIEELRKLFARLRAGKLPDDQMVVGAAVPYWKDLLARDPLATLAALPQPVLVLAGEKDYQVPPEHYRRWLEACRKGGKKNCSGRLFPGLNHLFMPVEGPSDGTEYQIPSREAPEVAEAMASWILGDGGDPTPES